MHWILWICLVVIALIICARHHIYSYKDKDISIDMYNRYFLIIAHPDDESMFFGPLISKILSTGGSISIAICTDGSKGGLPETRKKEMTELSIDHNIASYFLGYADGELVNSQDIQTRLYRLYKLTNSTKIITFDSKGVSSHKDHKTCYEIAKSISEYETAPIYTLKTINIIEKYLVSILKNSKEPHTQIICSTFQEAINNRARMFYHRSQITWYRYLYILFSFYMDYNILTRIK